MVRMRAEEARDFYEEDEDPARVFALFDAAEKGRTSPPDRLTPRESDLTPLRDLLRELGTQLKQDAKKLRLRHRLVLVLRHVANTLEQHTKV
jgi:hypothetical protein